MNRKKRKLEYIRTKNQLRTGKISMYISGMFSKMYVEEFGLDRVMKDEINECKDHYDRRFKLKFSPVKIEVEAFYRPNDTLSFRIELKVKP